MNISVTVTDNVSGRLKRWVDQAAGVMAQATRTVGNLVKDHLIRLNAQRPNALGGNRTNYYARAARGVLIEPPAGLVTIVQRGFRYQVKGGTIRPSGRLSLITGKPITHLTIPISPKAHGKNPSDLGPLFLLRSKERNQAYLARQQGRGKNAGIELLYVLKSSVTHHADPALLPSQQDVHAALHEALSRYFGA